MAVRLPFFRNSNGKIRQMEHCLSLKYVMLYRFDLENVLIWVNSWKDNWELKLNWTDATAR